MKKEKTPQEIFESQFSIWIVSTRGGGSFKARLNAEDLNLDPSDLDENIHLGNKDMISEKDRIFLNAAPGQIQNFMKTVSKRSIGRGLYAVPDNKFVAAQYGLTKIREAQAARVEDFLTRYEEVKRIQTAAHPNLAGESWPTPKAIRSFYGVDWIVLQVKAIDIKQQDPEEVVELKKEFQEKLARGYDELKDQILGESYIEILNAIDGIIAKLDAGEKISITETNFKKPRAALDQYLSIAAIFDLDTIRAKVEEVNAALTGTKAKDLREKPMVSAILKEKMKGLAKDLEGLTGYSKDGRMKRTLDLDEDPPAEANAA